MSSSTPEPESPAAGPRDVHYLDRDQLRLVADPLRSRLLAQLCHRALSARQLSERLEDVPSNLYYHLDRLRDAGLIELVATRQRRGAREKFYRAVARSFSASPDLLGDLPDDRSAHGEVLGVAGSLMESTMQDLARSLEHGLLGEGSDRVTPVISGVTVRASREHLETLRERLVDWLREACDTGEEDAEAEYTGLVLFFPTETPRPPHAGGVPEAGAGVPEADADRFETGTDVPEADTDVPDADTDVPEPQRGGGGRT